MTPIWVALIVFFAALTQSTAGFGFALVSMPFLVTLLGPIPAAALGALVAFTTQLVMMSRYRQAMSARGLWRLMLSAIVGIPLGIQLLVALDERIVLGMFGAFLMLYSLYSLIGPRIPNIRSSKWDFGIGFVSGLLGGAYNTGGPPFVIYGISKRWYPAEYKGNLQALLMVNSVTTIGFRLLYGHYTASVLTYYGIAVPMVFVGALVGFWLDHYIDAALLRRLVLVMLLIVGGRMVLNL